ncbi:excalibur calcium-binding domain-containing protein [Nocardioides salsibiostraticola]
MISAIVLLFLLGSCVAALPSSPEPVEESPTEAAPLATTPSEPPTPAQEPAPVLTQKELWRKNLEENEQSYLSAVATAFAVRSALLDIDSGALRTCSQIAASKPLNRRASRTARDFGVAKLSAFDRALSAMDETVTYICPELAETQQSQVTEREEAERIKAAKRAEAKRVKAAKLAKARQIEQRRAKAAERERAAAERREAEQRRAAEEARLNVYYGNCTDVENAGAAPIRRGEPGYSSSLDRDGDGIACEQ